MNELSKKFRDYYATGKYRGFCKIRERVFKLSGKTTITFSNGEKEVFASGLFKEQALSEAFKQIDNILGDKEPVQEETKAKNI